MSHEIQSLRHANSICLIADPGNTNRYQGNLYFAHRIAKALSCFDVCLIAPKWEMEGGAFNQAYFKERNWEVIDIKDTQSAVQKIKQAALIIQCPHLRKLPEVLRSILQEKEGQFLTINEYCLDTYISDAKQDEVKRADLLTGPSEHRLGIFIPPPIQQKKLKGWMHEFIKPKRALQGLAYGHTVSLAIFPWFVSQVQSDSKGPISVLLLLGAGMGLKIDDLRNKLREVHAEEAREVVLITQNGEEKLAESTSPAEKPLHIFLLHAPIAPGDMRVLEEIVAKNGGILHATGDQTVSDWASLEKAPRFVYETLAHKWGVLEALEDTLKKATEEATKKDQGAPYFLIQYMYAVSELYQPLTDWEQQQSLTPVSKAKECLSDLLIPRFKDPKTKELYKQFSSYLKEHFDLGKNLRAFVESRGIQPKPPSQARSCALL